jgi:hypothetical protein
MNNWKKNLIGTLIFMLSGCHYLRETEVNITKDYVINPNWSETNNSFVISRMNLKDSSKNISLQNTSESELYHGLIEDTSFIYYANILYNGEKYHDRKVYFNRDNGFLWRKNLHSSSLTKKILGQLQQDTWYLLKGLSSVQTTLYYIYLDSIESLHVFKVSTMTNY